MSNPTADEFVCCTYLTFEDGEAPEAQELHRGTKAECEKVQDLVPAVAYSGSRRVVTGELLVMPAKVFDDNTKPYGAANA